MGALGKSHIVGDLMSIGGLKGTLLIAVRGERNLIY
jgi:hypothetical protein